MTKTEELLAAAHWLERDGANCERHLQIALELREYAAMLGQEPVAWVATHESGRILHLSKHDGWTVEATVAEPDAPWSKPMGVHFPAEQAQPAPGLTDDEIIAEYCKIADGKEWAIGGLKDAMPFARAVLKAQKEKT